MTLRVIADDPGLSAETRAAFVGDVRHAFRVLSQIRRWLGLPSSQITAVAATDFVAAVDRYRRAPDLVDREGRFRAERLGGVVAAKNLRQDECRQVVIVYNAAFKGGPTRNGLDHAGANGGSPRVTRPWG